MAWHAIPRREILLEIFQPKPHRIQGIFHFVRHARGDLAERGETFETRNWRLRIVSRDSRSRSVLTMAPMRVPCSLMTCTLTPMRCGGRLASAVANVNLGAARPPPARIHLPAKTRAERKGAWPGGKISLFAVWPSSWSAGAPEEVLHRGTGLLTAQASSFAREEQQPVFQTAENLVQIPLRSVLKISRTPRNCNPDLRLILVQSLVRTHPLPRAASDRTRLVRCGPIARRYVRLARAATLLTTAAAGTPRPARK